MHAEHRRWQEWFVRASRSIRDLFHVSAPLIFEGDHCRVATHFALPPRPANDP